MNLLEELEAGGVIKLPDWVSHSTCYLSLTGSQSYGCSTPESDLDVYGFAVPPPGDVLPWLGGYIPGFDSPPHRTDPFQADHLAGPSGQEVDISVYGIVRYLRLMTDNNPNMLDSLFTADDCVLHINRVGRMVRDRRRLFLSKRCLVTYRGYAQSQIKKLHAKRPQEGSRRHATVQQYGFDLKYAVHLLRLTAQCRQVLVEGDMDLRRDRETLKAIRRGDWSQDDVMSWFEEKDAELGRIAEGPVAVPDRPDEKAIKTLLLECLEEHYGTLQHCVVSEHKAVQALREVRTVLDRAGV